MLRRLALSAVALATCAAFPSAAFATDAPSPGVRVSQSGEVTLSGSAAATFTSTQKESGCDDSADPKISCEVETTNSVSAITKATSTQLKSDAQSEASDGTSLAAAASHPIWTRTFSQTLRGLYYFNWVEKHTGRIYFDKVGHVWATTSMYGYKGSHTCGQGSGIGYSVKVTSCTVENRYDLNGPAISLWDYFQVHVVASGIPLYTSKHMHVNAYDGGTITAP
jgi:hypothetical protein